MLKFYFKIKKYFKEKGFTLVELLAVIVILAIIMLLAIPAVLSSMEAAKRKAFAEYVDKSSGLAQKQLAEDQMNGQKDSSSCYVYNVKSELGITNTGDYDGWVLINPSENDIYVTLFDDDYVLIGFHYSDSKLKMEDYLERRTSDKETLLTINELVGYTSCESYVVGDTEIPKTEKTAEIDYFGIVESEIYRITNGDYNSIVHIKQTYDIKDTSTEISSPTSEFPVYVWIEGDTLFWGSKANRIYLNPRSDGIFGGYKKLKSIDLSRIDTSEVTTMKTMFMNDVELEELDLSSFDTSKVLNMQSMFQGDTKLKKLNLTSFNVSKVTTFEWMFEECKALEELDLSSFHPENLGTAYAMFEDCNSLKKIKFNNFNSKICTSMSHMFHACSSIEEIDISSFNTSSVTNMWYMFEGCSNLKVVDLRNCDTSKVVNMSNMFAYDTELTTIYVNDSWSTASVTSGEWMFQVCNALVGDVAFDGTRDLTYAKYKGGYLTYKP